MHHMLGIGQLGKETKPPADDVLWLLPLQFIIFLDSEMWSHLICSPEILTTTTQLFCESRTEGVPPSLLPTHLPVSLARYHIQAFAILAVVGR